MRVEAYLSAAEVTPADVAEGTVVVVDVIRATSTIVEALANGARAIYPTLSTDEAIRLAQSLGRDDTLLCGERKGLKVDGFDLGNSPREFTADRVEGKRLVMSTTNGTRAFLAAAGARRVLAASFLNLGAVAEALRREGEAETAPGLAVICAGKEDRFSLDDAVCAGILLSEALAGRNAAEMNDGARACLALVDRFRVDAAFLATTAAGRALVSVGLEEDLAVCSHRDRHRVVPEMHDRQIRAAGNDG